MNTIEYAPLDFDRWPDYGMEKGAWLEARRKGLGSADIAGMLNLDRYHSPMSVYLDKIGEGIEVDENEMMHFGKRLEDVVATEFAERNDRRVIRPAAMYQHVDHPFALASPDRLVPTELDADPLEIKTGRNPDIWEGGPPNYYVVQVVHQMAVLGADHAHLAVLLNGRDYRDYEIERDAELEDILMEREQEFWRLVTDRIPPAVDGHQATTEALKTLYKRSHMGKAVVLTDDQAAWLSLKKEAAARLKLIEADHERAANELRAALGDAEVGLYDGEEVVTWKMSTGGKGRVDLDALEAEHPDLVAQYRKPVPSRRLLVK